MKIASPSDDVMNPLSQHHDFPARPPRIGSGDNYWLDGECLSRVFYQEIPLRTVDLLEVAMSVYAADRRSRRNYEGYNTGHRQIKVRVGLRDPSFWDRPEMLECLGDFLYWLSEDEWSFEFVLRQAPPAPAEFQGFLFRNPPAAPTRVSLFSGGLDSLAGLAKHTHESPVESHVLVSGYTHDRLASQQRRQVQMIEAAWRRRRTSGCGPELHHVAIPYGIDKPSTTDKEKSQRTRALVYLSLGAATAVQVESDTLFVYENGTGAINLPLNASQLGVDNYRGVHPRSLIKAERLFELALEENIEIRNPFMFETKAQMCGSLGVSGIADFVRETVSCDSYPLRVKGSTQCGICTSCILRRQAIQCAGLSEYDLSKDYLYDVLGSVANVARAKLHGLEVMQGHVYDLERSLSSGAPWLALASSFPELERICLELAGHNNEDVGRIRDKLINLYRTYVHEWKSFPHSHHRAA